MVCFFLSLCCSFVLEFVVSCLCMVFCTNWFLYPLSLRVLVMHYVLSSFGKWQEWTNGCFFLLFVKLLIVKKVELFEKYITNSKSLEKTSYLVICSSFSSLGFHIKRCYMNHFCALLYKWSMQLFFLVIIAAWIQYRLNLTFLTA